MLPCLKPSSQTARRNSQVQPPASEDYSENPTPRSSAVISPTVNLTREYTLAVQTDSYGEIWSRIHLDSPSNQNVEITHLGFFEEQLQLGDILRPSRECVQEALSHIRSDTFNPVVAAYFDQSEHTFDLCLLLCHCLHRARLLYAPLQRLLDVLPQDFGINSLTESQCDWAFDVFLEFDSFENPFPGTDSNIFDDMRQSFSQLKQQLEHRLHKSRSKVHILRRATRGSAICLIAAAVGVAISAVAIATHSFIALVASPLCPAFLPSKVTKKELAHLTRLDNAAKGIFVLQSHLDTIDRLVVRLYNAVEDDKHFLRLGLKRGKERHLIQEVVKHLRKNHIILFDLLTGLEEHLCLCFAAINRTRSLLLRQIHIHQTHE